MCNDIGFDVMCYYILEFLELVPNSSMCSKYRIVRLHGVETQFVGVRGETSFGNFCIRKQVSRIFILFG